MQLSDDDLLGKLQAKYERTSPGACSVCAAPLSVQHKGGGLPLTWACTAAALQISSLPAGTDQAPHQAHLEASRHLDYRTVGDARVMELVHRFRKLCAQQPGRS